MNFDHIIGHEKIIDNFKKAVANGRIAHSYIFEGPRSIGKKTTAIALAKLLLQQEKEIENQPDLKIIDKLGETIKKEDMEALQKDINIRPFGGNRKVYVISGAEDMTDRVQNIFLKTLEEPPEYVTIILTTTNKQKLLSTIVSRCQIVTFNPVGALKIEELLMDKYQDTKEKASFISQFSNGIIGRAIMISQSPEFELLRKETLEAIDTTVLGSKEKIFSTRDFFEKNKENIGEILDIMLLYFRDLIIYKSIKNDIHIINKDKIELIKSHYNRIETNSLDDIIETILKTKEDIDLKVNFSLSIEIMLLEIQEGRIWQL